MVIISRLYVSCMLWLISLLLAFILWAICLSLYKPYMEETPDLYHLATWYISLALLVRYLYIHRWYYRRRTYLALI